MLPRRRGDAAASARPGARGPIGRGRIRRVAVGLLLGLAVAVTGAGCQQIPVSGPVAQGRDDLSIAEPRVVYDPNSPSPGADPEQIVAGFVEAAQSSLDGYAVAREFLTQDYARQWDPSGAVFVFEGTRPFSMIEEDVGVLSLGGVATVDQHGVLAPTRPGPSTDMRFELREENGEWRISSAPTGIILERQYFDELWGPQRIYFLDAAGNLVPETRWFLQRPTLATQIVEELLAGPSESTAEALHTAFPSGATLASGSVPVVDASAQIDLSGDTFSVSAGGLEDIQRQLSASLYGVVSGYELLTDGASLLSGTVDARAGSLDRATATVADGKLSVVLGDGDARPLPELQPAIDQLDATGIALARDLSWAAVRGEGGVYRVDGDPGQPGDGSTRLVDAREGLLTPNIDSFGHLWSFSGGTEGRAIVLAPDGVLFELRVPWLSGVSPVAVRVSPDGSRLAALVGEGDQSAVIVGAIVRDADGTPVSVSETMSRGGWTTGKPLDLDWIDSSRFAMLSRVGEAGKVTMGGPGIFTTDRGSVPGGIAISGEGSRMQLRVLDADGYVFAPQGQGQGASGWQRQGSGVEMLAKIG